jgi:hypothetical protein
MTFTVDNQLLSFLFRRDCTIVEPRYKSCLVGRPPALFEVKGKISVDTATGRFIIILIR